MGGQRGYGEIGLSQPTDGTLSETNDRAMPSERKIRSHESNAAGVVPIGEARRDIDRELISRIEGNEPVNLVGQAHIEIDDVFGEGIDDPALVEIVVLVVDPRGGR